MKPIVFHSALAAVFLLAACEKKPAPVPPPAAPKPAAVTVTGKTGTVTERAMPRYLRVTGQLTGQNDAVVAADATGKVLEAGIERGSSVKTGDVLIKLDERQARLSLAEAEAAVELAKARLLLAKNERERNAPLAEKRAIADADFQKLVTNTTAGEAEVASAVARRDMAKKSLEDAIIRAPFPGVVAERMVEPGEYVRPDSPVARIVDLSTLRLILNVPETQVGQLATGQKVEFTTPAFPSRTFVATLKFLGAAMREASRDLVVEASVDNKDGALRPGFFCDARIHLKEEKCIAVVSEALRIDGNRRKVFVITSDHLLNERLVEVGETTAGFTELRRGASAGETVLLAPGPEAVDGAILQNSSNP